MSDKSISQAIRDWFIEPVLQALNQMEVKIMSQLDDLNAAIQAEDVQITTLQGVIVKIDADVAALLAKPGLPPDLTAQLQAIQSHTAALVTATAQLAADDASANK